MWCFWHFLDPSRLQLWWEVGCLDIWELDHTIRAAQIWKSGCLVTWLLLRSPYVDEVVMVWWSILTPGPFCWLGASSMSFVNRERQLAEGQQKTVCIADNRALWNASRGCSIGLKKAKQESTTAALVYWTMGIFILHIMSACHPYIGVLVGNLDVRDYRCLLFARNSAYSQTRS